MTSHPNAQLAFSIVTAIVLSCARRAAADEAGPDPPGSDGTFGAPDDAAPLPSKDVRWSATLGGAIDAGSVTRASPGLVLGGDVRRGALEVRALASAIVAQRDHRSGTSAALYDFMTMICALAPFGSRFDVGACGGGGLGLLRAERRDARSRESGVAFRPQALAIARLEVAFGPAVVVFADAGTIVDPFRTLLPVTTVGNVERAPLFAFRGALGVLVRVW